MTDDLRGDLQIRDRDLAVVLRKATELLELRGSGAPTSGLTLAEVERLAADVGIDPALVRRVAQEIPPSVPDTTARVLGAPPRQVFETRVGRALSEAEMGELVALARRELKEFGEVSTGVAGVTWMATGGLGETTLNLIPAEDGTTVQILSNLDTDEGTLIGILTPTFGVVLGIVIAGAASLGTPLALTATGATLVTVLGGVRAWWGSRARRFHTRMERLAHLLGRSAERLTLADSADDPA